MKKIFVFLSLLILAAFISGCLPSTKPTVESIEVVSDKTSFDETFELGDLLVRVHMSDGNDYTVPLQESMISASDLLLLNQEGTHNITVNYLALSAAFEITITAEDGREVELQATTEYIQWRYVGESTWNNLVALAVLKGTDGTQGTNGKEVEFQTSATHIQWRYVGDAIWLDLVAIDNLKGDDGADGKEVELQTSTTHIQWRYVGDATWTDLIALSSLEGQDGATGADGKQVEFQTTTTHIQWRFVGDTTWTDLVALSSLKGQDGTSGEDGAPGKQVEFNVSITHIQWRYVGDPTWLDLVALSSLKGEAGLTPTIEINQDGYWVINGTVTTYKASGSGTYIPVELTVTFDTMGGVMPEGVPAVMTDIPKGDSIDLPIPTLDGYIFCGWFSGFGVNDGQFTNVMAVTKNMTLYALWEEDLQPLIDFMSIADTKNYTAIYVQEREVLAGQYSEHYVDTETVAISYHDGALHLHRTIVESFDGVAPKGMNNAASETWGYYTNEGKFHYEKDDYQERWHLFPIDEGYHPSFTKEMFDLDLFTKRPGEPIYDYTVTDEFLSMLQLELPVGVDVVVTAYVDVLNSKAVINMNMSGIMEGQSVTATMTMSAQFTEVGTTNVTFPVETIKSNLLTYIDEDAATREELAYADPTEVQEFNEMIANLKAQVNANPTVQVLANIYANFEWQIYSFQFNVPPIVYYKIDSKNQLTNQFLYLAETATLDSVAAMKVILETAKTAIDAAETIDAIDQIVVIAQNDLQNAFIEDPTIVYFRQQKEQYLEQLLHMYESYMDATEIPLEKEDIQNLYDFHFEAIQQTEEIVALEDAFEAAFEAFYQLNITIREGGLDGMKRGLMSYVAMLYGQTFHEEFNEPLYDFYMTKIVAVRDATALLDLMVLYRTLDGEFNTLLLTEAKFYALAKLAVDAEPYLETVDPLDDVALTARYNEVFSLIQNATNVEEIFSTIEQFLYVDVDTFTYDELALDKMFTIRNLEFEHDFFVKTATDASILILDQLLIDHSAIVQAAASEEDVDTAYDNAYQAFEAAYVHDETKDIQGDMDAMHQQMLMICELLFMVAGEENAYIYYLITEIESHHLSFATSIEEIETIYDDWFAFIQTLPITVDPTQIDLLRGEIIEQIEMLHDEVVENVLELPETFETEYQAHLLLMQNTPDLFEFAEVALDTYYFLMEQMVSVFRQEALVTLQEWYDEFASYVSNESLSLLDQYYLEATTYVATATDPNQIDYYLWNFRELAANLSTDPMKMAVYMAIKSLEESKKHYEETATTDSVMAMEALIDEFKVEVIICETVDDVWYLVDEYTLEMSNLYVIDPLLANDVYLKEVLKGKIQLIDSLIYCHYFPENVRDEINKLIYDNNGYWDQIENAVTLAEAEALFDDLMIEVISKNVMVPTSYFEENTWDFENMFHNYVTWTFNRIKDVPPEVENQIEGFFNNILSASDFNTLLNTYMTAIDYSIQTIEFLYKQQVTTELTEVYQEIYPVIIDDEVESLQVQFAFASNLIQTLINPEDMTDVFYRFEKFANNLTYDDIKGYRYARIMELTEYAAFLAETSTADSAIEMFNLVDDFAVEISSIIDYNIIDDKTTDYVTLIDAAYVLDETKDYFGQLKNFYREDIDRYRQMFSLLGADYDTMQYVEELIYGAEGYQKIWEATTFEELELAHTSLVTILAGIEFTYDPMKTPDFMDQSMKNIQSIIDNYGSYLYEKVESQVLLEDNLYLAIELAQTPQEVIALINDFLLDYVEVILVATKDQLFNEVVDFYNYKKEITVVDELDELEAAYQAFITYIPTSLTFNLLYSHYNEFGSFIDELTIDETRQARYYQWTDLESIASFINDMATADSVLVINALVEDFRLELELLTDVDAMNALRSNYYTLIDEALVLDVDKCNLQNLHNYYVEAVNEYSDMINFLVNDWEFLNDVDAIMWGGYPYNLNDFDEATTVLELETIYNGIIDELMELGIPELPEIPGDYFDAMLVQIDIYNDMAGWITTEPQAMIDLTTGIIAFVGTAVDPVAVWEAYITYQYNYYQLYIVEYQNEIIAEINARYDEALLYVHPDYVDELQAYRNTAVSFIDACVLETAINWTHDAFYYSVALLPSAE